MIRHIVLWSLHEPERAQEFATMLRRCARLVDGQRGYWVATRAPGLQATCDVGLVADFEDLAALQVYLDHPLHREVSAALAPLRRDRHVLDVPTQ